MKRFLMLSLILLLFPPCLFAADKAKLGFHFAKKPSKKWIKENLKKLPEKSEVILSAPINEGCVVLYQRSLKNKDHLYRSFLILSFFNKKWKEIILWKAQGAGTYLNASISSPVLLIGPNIKWLPGKAKKPNIIFCFSNDHGTWKNNSDWNRKLLFFSKLNPKPLLEIPLSSINEFAEVLDKDKDSGDLSYSGDGPKKPAQKEDAIVIVHGAGSTKNLLTIIRSKKQYRTEKEKAKPGKIEIEVYSLDGKKKKIKEKDLAQELVKSLHEPYAHKGRSVSIE